MHIPTLIAIFGSSLSKQASAYDSNSFVQKVTLLRRVVRKKQILCPLTGALYGFVRFSFLDFLFNMKFKMTLIHCKALESLMLIMFSLGKISI